MFVRKNDIKISKSTDINTTEHTLINREFSDFIKNTINNFKTYCKTNTRQIILSAIAFIAVFSIFCFVADTAWTNMDLESKVDTLSTKTTEDEKIKQNLQLKASQLQDELSKLQKEKNNIELYGNKTQQELDEIKKQQEQREKELYDELEKLEDYINNNYDVKISKSVASRGASTTAFSTDPFLDKVESFYAKVVTYKGANEATEDLRIAIDAAKVEYIGYMNKLPDARPLKSIRITSGFGYRRDPFTGRKAFHSGIDLGAPKGTPIYSAGAGKVIFSGYNSGGFGNLVIISHDNGIKTLYAHCSSLYVKEGDIVGKGDKIAAVGSTGRSTGPHLHFEVQLNGKPVDPRGYVKF